jgi:hypothetical protein
LTLAFHTPSAILVACFHRLFADPSLTCRFINRDDLDFATIANMAPVQEWDLQEANDGSLEYPTQ